MKSSEYVKAIGSEVKLTHINVHVCLIIFIDTYA